MTGDLRVSLFYKYFYLRYSIGKENMTLWGNSDVVGSLGIVTVNYDTKVVTGSGTTFDETGESRR